MLSFYFVKNLINENDHDKLKIEQRGNRRPDDRREGDKNENYTG